MSESEYRSAQEAARARIAVLEAELREIESVPEKSPPAPDAAAAEEKRKLRDRLQAMESARRLVSVVITLGVLVVARLVLFHSQPGASSSPTAAFFAVACALLVAWWLRKPGRQERALEKELHAIVKHEDLADRRFRVESEPIRKRVVLQELEEARALIDDEAEEEKLAREKN